MRILIVTQYFWPENFRINDLALGLLEKGHHVEILTGKPNYPSGQFSPGYNFANRSTEFWNDIKIHRAPLISRGKSGGIRLMLNYFSFAFFASFRAMFIGGKFDKILVYEPSPITVGIPAIVLKYIKRAPIFFWVQDLWPHSVSAAGGIQNKFLLKLLESLTKWIYAKSNKILIQSEGFKEVLLSQSVKAEKIIYYPNTVENFFNIMAPDPTIERLLPNGFRVMFAGNIGESQDFDTMIEAAKLTSEKNPDIKWIILGDGRKKKTVLGKIKEYSLENNFYLMGSFPAEDMPKFFSSADCLLVSLKKDYIYSLTIPSKVQSYLACGKPIIASLEGEGAKIVTEARAGLCSEPEDPIMLSKCILSIGNLSKKELEFMGLNSRAYFDGNFERDLLITKLENIFQDA